MQRVFVAADPAQAEAIRLALADAGIAAQVILEDDGQGGARLEIAVPAGQARQATRIIAEGNWPRLA